MLYLSAAGFGGGSLIVALARNFNVVLGGRTVQVCVIEADTLYRCNIRMDTQLTPSSYCRVLAVSTVMLSLKGTSILADKSVIDPMNADRWWTNGPC